MPHYQHLPCRRPTSRDHLHLLIKNIKSMLMKIFKGILYDKYMYTCKSYSDYKVFAFCHWSQFPSAFLASTLIHLQELPHSFEQFGSHVHLLTYRTMNSPEKKQKIMIQSSTSI
jgi:hypothetical protein